MVYSERLRSSFAGLWRNPSLFFVLLFEFVARMILVVLFLFLDVTVVGALNSEALAAMTTENLSFLPLLNPTTILILLLLLVLQMIILLYINSFFSAGFFGMVKNTTVDGSTTLREFLPSVKRYWAPIFRFLFIRYGLMLVFSIPLALALLSVLGTTPGFVDTGQWVLLGVAFAISLLVGLILFYWLFYGEPSIVFEDLSATAAVKRSWQLSRQNIGLTAGALATVIAIVIIASTITALILTPFDMKISSALAADDLTTAQSWTTARDIVDLILNIITLVASVITAIFVFLTYGEAVGGKRHRMQEHLSHKVAKKPAVKTVRKR